MEAPGAQPAARPPARRLHSLCCAVASGAAACACTLKVQLVAKLRLFAGLLAKAGRRYGPGVLVIEVSRPALLAAM